MTALKVPLIDKLEGDFIAFMSIYQHRTKKSHIYLNLRMEKVYKITLIEV